MRKLFVAIYLACFVANTLAAMTETKDVIIQKANKLSEKTVEFKIHPLFTLWGNCSGELNFRLNEHLTVGARGWFSNNKSKASSYNYAYRQYLVALKGYSYGVQVLFFPGSNQESGLYLGAGFDYADSEILLAANNKMTFKLSKGVSTAGKLGYQWAWKSGFVVSSQIEAGLGPNFESYTFGFTLLSVGLAV